MAKNLTSEQQALLDKYHQSQQPYDVGDPNKYGESYAGLVSANPYANMTYRKSPWQSLLESLGFRTNYDAYKESLALQAKEYDAAIAQKAYNESYDSPLAQAARQRAAGLNPDLNGEVDSGSSSPLQDDGNPPIAPESDLDQISGFGSMVLSAVQMATGLANTGIGFASQIASLRGQKLDNDNKFLSNAFDALLSVMSPDQLDTFKSSEDLSAHIVSYLPSLTSVYGKKRAQQYVDAVTALSKGLKGQDLEYTMRKHRVGERSGWYDYINNSGYSEFDDVMKLVRKFYSEDLWQALKHSASASNMRAQNDETYEKAVRPEEMEDTMQYHQALSGTAMGEADQTIRGSEAEMASMKAGMRKAFDTLMTKINHLADGGNSFADLVSVALAFLGIRYFGM